MSDGEKVASVCDELADLFRTVGTRGVTLEDISMLEGAVENARLEIARLTSQECG
jgi:hypothetical protein